jgi:hypothetical protein
MNFTVTWHPDADDQIAAIWTAASDRAAVTDAARRTDLVLGHNPLGVGESRGGNIRLLFERPLAILYRVDDATRTVHVVSVSTARRPH